VVNFELSWHFPDGTFGEKESTAKNAGPISLIYARINIK